MDKNKQFLLEKKENIRKIGDNKKLQSLSRKWMREVSVYRYDYHFTWLGRPIIQYPQDIVAMQEIIWEVKPDCIIETGVAHGGSLVFNASMLALLELSGHIRNGKAIGIDIHIRPHNRKAIIRHPMSRYITLIEGSSVDPDVIRQVNKTVKGKKKILVSLDSNHTHDHVLEELRAYSRFVSVGSYCVVFDTRIEEMPRGFFPDRPWGKGNNPRTALKEFLKGNKDFYVNREVGDKLLITVAQDGYLRRMRG